MNGIRLVSAGESAVVVEFDERIDAETNGRAIAAARSIRAANVAGVRDIVPTFRSVTVYFDPLRTDARELAHALERCSAHPASAAAAAGRPPIRVPVCYGGSHGPDLDDVASFAGMKRDEVITLHAGRPYRVYMLGFVPGFAYLASVDDRIAAPRLETPRTRVPIGSVGIAGSQTGIYPAETPGGWRLIGRTTVKPFDLTRSQPVLFEAGDLVEFYPIDEAEYARCCA